MATPLLIAIALVMHPLLARPADVSGAWTVTITTADGKITGEATLEQTGSKVTGHIGPTGDATIAIAGTLEGNTLTLKTSHAPGRTAAFDICELTVADDKMSGTIKGGDAG